MTRLGSLGAVAAEGLVVAHGAVPAVRGIGFTAAPGEFLTLLGPSGCGKTTTLRAIAGLETPRAGRIAIGGQKVFDAADGVDLPPERRGLAMVFQSYAIWPHMTVFENVAFGLRARGVRKAALGDVVRRSLDLVGLADFANRPATRLSGGQQQRVALARSIAGDPAVILLDEPLSNLDAQLRLAMRAELKSLQRRLGLTAIYVTHDQEEALALSDRILVMREGAIAQAGTPQQILDAPASRFVAAFMGVRNILPCIAERGGGAMTAVLKNGVRLPARGDGGSFVCFRPASVRLSAAPEPGAHPAEVAAATCLGDIVEYELRCGEVALSARELSRRALPPGTPVFWRVDPDDCFLLAD
ncbi:MAG TPA: ABC transporter ATP-binding protein [Acetobacteraceae bacterium]|nr:ABC transporter ATP-binding protein [Acetobacteraceae bacterium]